MSALLASTAVVAIAEIGDKTQLLALMLAARFRRPLPIIAGIAVATLLNHALAAWAGAWIALQLGPQVLRWLVAASFVAIGLWALRPDSMSTEPDEGGRLGVFVASLSAFFLAEIGDKTQVATIVLAAHYEAIVQIVLGTTLGMLIANVPVVIAGGRLLQRVPLKLIRWGAAAMFVAMGVAVLLGAGSID